MFPSSLRSYGGNRKDSAIRTLVAETLVLAKTHGCVEKIESELEEELRRDSKGPPTDPLSKWRRKGDKVLKSKYVLLTVALFCVTDCALVLGELILDLHKVKDTLETSESAIREFKAKLHKAYPREINDTDANISDVFELIVKSRIIWYNPHDNSSSSSSSSILPSASSSLTNSSDASPASSDIAGVSSFSSGPSSSSSSSSFFALTALTSHDKSHRRGTRSVSNANEVREYVVVVDEVRENLTSHVKPLPGGQGFDSEGEGRTHSQEHGHEEDGKHKKGHVYSLEEEIAHALHIVSLTMMACLVFETLLKAFCAGLPFFKRKLETFDFFIVIVSFIVDLAFMQILPRFEIQDFVFILAFLLPWRVIRVVNSLVVAVQDHEHFRLKLVYSRKKKIQNSLRETEVKLQLFRAQCCALKRLCINEGVEEAKIEQIVQLDEYVVNKTGKSKCKVKIDNSSVILLDKSDFPRLSPRPSLSCLVEKKRSTPGEGGKDGKSDKSPKKGALKDSPGRRDTLALICSDDAHKDHMRVPLSLFSNGPRKKRWNLLGLGRDGTVKRAGSFSQICQNPPNLDGLGFLSAHGPNGKVKRAGSHSLLCGGGSGGLGQLNVSMDEREEDDASSLALAASSPDESPFIIDKLFQSGITAVSRDLAHPLSEPVLPSSPPCHETPTKALHQGDSSGSFNPNLLQAPEFCDTFANVSGDKVHDIEKVPNLPQAEKTDPGCEAHEEQENTGDGTKLETHPSVFDRGKETDCCVQTGDQQGKVDEGQVTFTLLENGDVSEVCTYFQHDDTPGDRFEVASCQEAEEGTPFEERLHPSTRSHPLSELCVDSDVTSETSGVDLASVEGRVHEDHPLEDEKARDHGHHMLEGTSVCSRPAAEETAPSEDDCLLHAVWEPLPFGDHPRNSCPEAAQPALDVTSLTTEGTRTQNGCRVSSTESVDQVIQTNGLPHMYK